MPYILIRKLTWSTRLISKKIYIIRTRVSYKQQKTSKGNIKAIQSDLSHFTVLLLTYFMYASKIYLKEKYAIHNILSKSKI